ncbi:MAG TPA: hypothetical protein VG937_01985 [Polyangiaceae bacterium]|nr:hypothetical protein [Polyangiaceae bacterium]
MSDAHFPPDPPPLGSEAGAAARLLAQAEREFRGGLDEGAAFRRLERSRRRRSALLWAACTGGALAAGLALFSGSQWTPRQTGRVELTAESRLPAARATSATALPVPVAAERLEPAVSAPVLATASAARPGAEPSAAPTESLCRKLSAGGRTERAIECFRAVAHGDGLEGEVALYEAARLSADVARDPARALGLLGEYERRFASGAMRGEAAWLRVRSLHAAGRVAEALAASEALLESPEGRALASELHWLRGRIYQENQHDCGQAASEFVALVGEPGLRGDEAELRRARCLEQLGRGEDAALAYQRYLTRSDPQRAAEARERLSALRP